MALSPIIDGPQLFSLVITLYITVQNSVFYYQFAGNESKEYRKTLLPTLGIAMMAEAISMLVFLGSAMWTGKLCKVSFICWQVVYVVICAAYALSHWPGMSGLWIGATWSASVALNVWITLLKRVEAETAKKKRAMAAMAAMAAMVATAHTSTSIAEAQDGGNDLEKANIFPSNSKNTSWYGRYAGYYMAYSFFWGAFGFVYAYMVGLLNIALSSFGIGFMVMSVVALLLLNLASTSEARRLARYFDDWHTVSAAIFVMIGWVSWGQEGGCFFGLAWAVLWSAFLYTGIAEVLREAAFDKNSITRQPDGGDAERGSIESSDSWVTVE